MIHDRPFEQHYDAIIVGARCAGASTALLLARQGARVLVVDWSGPASETVSTHALMRGAVLQLDRWGVLPQIRASGTPVIRKTTFHYGRDSVALPIKPTPGVDGLYAPRRRVLDSALVSAAAQAGATIRYGVAFRDVMRDVKGRVVGAVLSHAGSQFSISADIVIGADGRRSTVARRVHAQTEKSAKHATACVYGYFDAIPDTGTHWYYVPGLGSGLIPTNDGQHCVFAAMPADRFKSVGRRARTGRDLAQIIAEASPVFGSQIRTAPMSGRLTGFLGQKGFTRRSWGRGWALVGDAGYFKDPLTAHGISDALRDAEILSDAVCEGTTSALARYQVTRDTLTGRFFEITDEIAGLAWDLPRLKSLHHALSDEMKAQQTWMTDTFCAQPLAA